MKKLVRRINEERHGQALVEFALMVPVLLLIIAGIVESGRVFQTYLQLANATREGARVASVIPQVTSAIESAVKRELPSDVSTSINITVACAAAGSSTFDNCITSYPPASGDKLAVTVSYFYTPIMPVLNGLTTFTALTMSTTTTIQVQ